MTSDRHDEEASAPELDYLCVDEFLSGLLEARSLATALQIGLIDILAREHVVASVELGQRLAIEPRGLEVLLGLLRAGGVCDRVPDGYTLSRRFRRALGYRDLLELKLAYASLVACDVHDRFTELITNRRGFQSHSRIYGLFRYDRCLEPTPENVEYTRRWVQITTGLTRHEAGVVLARHDFSQYRRVLDIGGNSGEFVLRILRHHTHMEAMVFDLPVVCLVGRSHVGREPEAGRIVFVPGHALKDPVPGGFDLVTFKSFLHDWPDSDICHFLARAGESLVPGGTLLIFERAPIEIGGSVPGFSLIPGLLFMHCYRSASFYVQELSEQGFEEIEARTLMLEMPFHLITARKRP